MKRERKKYITVFRVEDVKKRKKFQVITYHKSIRIGLPYKMMMLKKKGYKILDYVVYVKTDYKHEMGKK